MKKITLITIVFLLITCFGFFGQAAASNFLIEGTLWQGHLKAVGGTPAPLTVEPFNLTVMLGFNDGRMFACIPVNEETCTPDFEIPIVIIDRPLMSLAYVNVTHEFDDQGYTRIVAIMLPIGVGYLSVSQRNTHGPDEPNYWHGSGLMFKVSDDWMS